MVRIGQLKKFGSDHLAQKLVEKSMTIILKLYQNYTVDESDHNLKEIIATFSDENFKSIFEDNSINLYEKKEKFLKKKN